MIKAEFIERRDRFTAIVKVEGSLEKAHVPNSGRMKELLTAGAEIYLNKIDAAHRSTKYDLSMVRYNGFLVSIDSRVPNAVIAEAVDKGYLDAFKGFMVKRREVKYGNSRLDILLSDGSQLCYVEVKSVTLVEEGIARFPDAPTERGARHLNELAQAVSEGHRGAAVFLVQREDAVAFAPNWKTDPQFARTLAEVAAKGVEVYTYICNVNLEGIQIIKSIPVELEGFNFP